MTLDPLSKSEITLAETLDVLGGDKHEVIQETILPAHGVVATPVPDVSNTAAQIMVQANGPDNTLDCLVQIGDQVGVTTLADQPEDGRVQASFRLNPTTAASLMDALWSNGVRPSNGMGGPGSHALLEKQVAILERNLDDLRRFLPRNPS